MIASYFRGRTSIGELLNMPVSVSHILYNLAIERNEKDKENGEDAGMREVAEQLEDEMG